VHVGGGTITVTTHGSITATGVDELIVTDAAGRILASPADPRMLGRALALDGSRTDSDGAWAGVAQLGGLDHVVARVPVLNNKGQLVGTVISRPPVPDHGRPVRRRRAEPADLPRCGRHPRGGRIVVARPRG